MAYIERHKAHLREGFHRRCPTVILWLLLETELVLPATFFTWKCVFCVLCFSGSIWFYLLFPLLPLHWSSNRLSRLHCCLPWLPPNSAHDSCLVTPHIGVAGLCKEEKSWGKVTLKPTTRRKTVAELLCFTHSRQRFYLMRKSSGYFKDISHHGPLCAPATKNTLHFSTLYSPITAHGLIDSNTELLQPNLLPQK